MLNYDVPATAPLKVVRPDGFILYCDNTEVFGIQSHEFLGQNLRDYCPDFDQLATRLLTHKIVRDFEFRLNLPDPICIISDWDLVEDEEILLRGVYRGISKPDLICSQAIALNHLRREPQLARILNRFDLDISSILSENQDEEEIRTQILNIRAKNPKDPILNHLSSVMPVLASRADAVLPVKQISVFKRSEKPLSATYPIEEYLHLHERSLLTMNQSPSPAVTTAAPDWKAYEPLISLVPGMVYLHQDSPNFEYLAFQGDQRRLNKPIELLEGKPVDYYGLPDEIAKPRKEALEKARSLGIAVRYEYKHYWNGRWWHFSCSAAPVPGLGYATQILDTDPEQEKWWRELR